MLPTLTPLRLALCSVLLLAVTACGGGDESPDLTPARGDIVFMVNRGGWGEIWTMSRDGSNRQRLTDVQPAESDAAGAASPDWSPDGSKIVYSAQLGLKEDLSLSEIYVVNADGSDRRQLTDNHDYDADPAWSPDGARIAFTRVVGVGGRRPHGGIVVMNADGSGARQVTRPGPDNLDGTPDWSPDGSRIVFTRGTFRTGSAAPQRSLYSVKLDGTGLERISDRAGEASFSSDGRKIAFTTTRDRLGVTCFHDCTINSEIYVMDADGSHQRRLTRSKANDRSPAWSPDGKTIAFVSDRSNPKMHENEIYVIDPNGRKLRRVTQNPAWDLEPAWRPSRSS